jgi:hypothetical protein
LLATGRPAPDYLLITGNDYIDLGTTAPITVPPGVSYFDHVGMVVLPFAGAYASHAAELGALQAGVREVGRVVEAR